MPAVCLTDSFSPNTGILISVTRMIVPTLNMVYTRYKEGIEIEVDTIPSERRKGLASVVCAALILACLDEGLYPSWDAHDMNSVQLSRNFGYEFDHEYTAYEVCSSQRTH